MVVKVIYINAFEIPDSLPSSCACIGYFDGIHIGHQKLISKCLQVSKEKDTLSSFITFDPDPWTVFHQGEIYHHLTPLKDKIKIVESFGFDNFYCIHFTKEFASLSLSSFHDVLNQLHITDLVCGFDFKYAYRNSGNIETLKNQSFNLYVIDSVNLENTKISTSRIEPNIINGHMILANQLLGYIYSVSGTIEHGFKRGSNLLCIPTANLKVDDEYILPKTGVYCGYVFVNKTYYKAMINVGNNPTFDNQKLTIEAHLLDFNEDIYDCISRFFFYTLIREEVKFEDFQHLKQQLLQDIETTRLKLEKDSQLYKNTQNIWNK